MDVRQAYNHWASQYDTNENKTRDLEARALRTTLPAASFEQGLEIGCGTGKNTSWLMGKVQHVTAVDLSEEMLNRARKKIATPQVQFVQADITKDWTFARGPYDLITFSLVLEHIENLDHIFLQASQVIRPGGLIYIGELHPFKQYTGSKARFETENGVQVVTCFNHHISDFIQPARKHGFTVADVNEYFDDEIRTGVPRILTVLLKHSRP